MALEWDKKRFTRGKFSSSSLLPRLLPPALLLCSTKWEKVFTTLHFRILLRLLQQTKQTSFPLPFPPEEHITHLSKTSVIKLGLGWNRNKEQSQRDEVEVHSYVPPPVLSSILLSFRFIILLPAMGSKIVPSLKRERIKGFIEYYWTKRN
jgi:hypothetical protein